MLIKSSIILVLASIKKDKMVSCEAPECTNRADKNSNIIT